jgi:phosphomannomutase
MSDLFSRVVQWVSHDPDPATRLEVQSLADEAARPDSPSGRAALVELESRFDGTLQFGTAGLRGVLGGGPARMNRAVVIRATSGLSRYLRDTVGEGFTVVVGFDARHGSAQFARDAAAVVAAAGGRATVLDSAAPTPVLSFAVRHLCADAGVMVTASHNPARDNGYKVYLGGRVAPGASAGVQIIAPADAEILTRIEAAPPADEVPYAPDGWRTAGPEILEAYLARLAAVAGAAEDSDLRIVLTPLHGVGGTICRDALVQAGFSDVYLVPEQAEPHPDFPTVAFPNPEEPGALDLALALAAQTGADLLLANDPDADRCSVAVPDPARGGAWRQLTGDEVGALLGEYLASKAAADAEPETPSGVFANSIVSSRLLGKIARHHGLGHRTTLTGFKWIARTEELIYGYEEAIGYCLDPDAVRDKDGISAAVVVAHMANDLKQQGLTLVDALDDLARRHGLHGSRQLSFRLSDRARIADALERLRNAPPSVLGGSAVVKVVDLAVGTEELAATEGLMLFTADDDRVIVRPSGTEPKLKCYLEAVAPVNGGGPVAHEWVNSRLSALAQEMTAALAL